MFFSKDKNCFIHLKTDQPCSILMRLSLLFNFFKPFLQCFAVLEQQMGQHCPGWRGHKTRKRCAYHQRHPPGPVKTLCTHSMEELESYKAISLTECTSNIVIFHIFNSSWPAIITIHLLCFCFHLIFRASIYCWW